MNQLLFLWTIMISLLLPSIPLAEQFDDIVDEGYFEYAVVEDYENIYFRIKVVHGYDNDQLTFGILVYNADARSHKLFIRKEDALHRIESNSRGDYLAFGIRQSEDLEILIVDDKENVRYSLALPALTYDEFLLTYQDTLTGQDKGVALSSLKPATVLSTVALLVIIFSSIIILCSGIIIIMVIMKRGIFHPDRQTDIEFQYREFLDSLKKQEEKDIIDDASSPEKEDRTFEPTKRVNPYPSMRDYDDEDDEDNNDAFNIKEYLEQKGYNTNYEQATEFEKEDIMLQLMQMRDLHDITDAQYKKEVIKLWKK